MKYPVAVIGLLLVCGTLTAVPLDGEQCASCHEIEAESRHHAYHGDCVSCHVSAIEHAEAEDARENAPRDARPPSIAAGLPSTMECQSCHVQDSARMNFAFNHHNKAGVQCMDCHGNHTPKIKSLPAGMERAARETALCASCHQDILARFTMRSHHPVREGGLSCNDCHDPHGSTQTSLAGKTSQCTQCHQDVRGPHMFEHAPTAEDCTNCHNPHGTPNKFMLSLAEPMLCLQCHSLTANRHGATTPGTYLSNCSSCHGAPHGSHIDQHLRY